MKIKWCLLSCDWLKFDPQTSQDFMSPLGMIPEGRVKNKLYDSKAKKFPENKNITKKHREGEIAQQ